MSSNNNLVIISLLILLVLVRLSQEVAAECSCEAADLTHDPKNTTTRYKLGAIVAILLASALGVSLPVLGKNIPAFSPGGSFFFLVKAFAAGIILSTAFIHILPDAFESLTSPCLKDHPWGKFPFAGLAAMAGAIATLVFEAFATGYYSRAHNKAIADVPDSQFHTHTHAHTHTHTHGAISPAPEGLSYPDLIKYKVTSQVLEVGIIVHSVIIGISLGTSQSLNTIKPLMVALCFHQLFEGIGLGGCIVQAAFNRSSIISMGVFFSLTTPLGIGIGLAVMNGYDENSPKALIVQGLLDACAAGILIYMSLVDLLAQDFMSPKLQSSSKLFLATNLSLLLGAAFMAVLAIWA